MWGFCLTMALNWIKYKDKKILYIDYSNYQLEEILPQMRKAAEVCFRSKYKVLILANFENISLGKSYQRKKLIDECMSMGKNIFLHHTDKSAVIGLSGIKKMFYSMYIRFTNHNIKLFKTKEEALDYLVVSDPKAHEMNEESDLVF